MYRRIIGLTLALLCAGGLGAQTVTVEDISALKAQIAAQQKQIEELQRAAFPKLGEVASTAPVIPAGSPAPVAPLATPAPAQEAAPDQPSPLQIHIGDATITPIGFMDLTNTWRSTNSGASLATNFGNFPYNNTVQGRLNENKLSAQNSRLGLRVDAMVKNYQIIGYYEGDFVGQVASNNTQVTSNSMSYRVRLYWIDVRKNSFEMLAGQSWSLMTPNRKGLSALPGDLFYGQEFDVNYLNGLVWGRIPGVRFLWHAPGDKVVAGISLENADQYFGGSGGGGIPTLPAAFAGNTFNNEIDANQTNGITVPSVHPDIIGKIAFEPVRRVHFEIAGVESTVKTFNPGTGQYFTKAGGGGAINGNFELFKNFHVITNNFWSDGAGRYIFGEAPNFIIRPNGSPSLVHSGSTVDGIEAQAKKTLFYAYYGGIYVGRNTAIDTNGSPIGYGYGGSANNQNRGIQEITGGFIQTLWRDGRYGALQLMGQYAYFMREPWYVAANAPKAAQQNAVWFDIRYVLPGTAPTIEY